MESGDGGVPGRVGSSTVLVHCYTDLVDNCPVGVASPVAGWVLARYSAVWLSEGLLTDLCVHVAVAVVAAVADFSDVAVVTVAFAAAADCLILNFL